MLVLAFDTATPAVTAAVCDGADVLAETSTVDERRHGELLMPAIESAMTRAGLEPQDLDAIAVGVGPGPFTSLRVGLVTARTLGSVLGIPVHGVCSLDAIALEADRTGEFLVATDARRREVYWARYVDGTRVDGPGVAKPADLGWDGTVVGFGGQRYPEVFGDHHPPEHVRASALAAYLHAGNPVLEPVPLYLRRPDVSPSSGPKRVLR